MKSRAEQDRVPKITCGTTPIEMCHEGASDKYDSVRNQIAVGGSHALGVNSAVMRFWMLRCGLDEVWWFRIVFESGLSSQARSCIITMPAMWIATDMNAQGLTIAATANAYSRALTRVANTPKSLEALTSEIMSFRCWR